MHTKMVVSHQLRSNGLQNSPVANRRQRVNIACNSMPGMASKRSAMAHGPSPIFTEDVAHRLELDYNMSTSMNAAHLGGLW